MKTAPVKIEYPYGASEEVRARQEACNAVLAKLEEKSKTTTEIEKLDRNGWLIGVNTNLQTLARLLSQAEAIGVPTKTAFLEEGPAWISIDPTGEPKGP